MKNVRIMHTGDLHLGSAFASLGDASALIRKKEYEKVCMSIFADARDFDAVLLAGDVFDFGNVSEDIADMFLSVIRSCADTKFFWSCGNHDPYFSPVVSYCLENSPDNLHIFSPYTLEYVELPELKLRIYGRSFPERNVFESYVNAGEECIVHSDDGYTNILCMHAQITNEAYGIYNPVNVGNLEECGFDYAGLGHVHSFSGILKSGKVLYAYCGCPAGRGFDECGAKGYISLDICESKVNSRFVETLCRRYVDEKVDISEINSYEEIISLINDICGTGNICRVELIGENHIGPFLNLEYIEKSADLFSLECIDNTRQIISPGDFCDNVTLRGICASKAVEKINSSKNEKEKEIIKKAFALLNAEFDKR